MSDLGGKRTLTQQAGQVAGSLGQVACREACSTFCGILGPAKCLDAAFDRSVGREARDCALDQLCESGEVDCNVVKYAMGVTLLGSHKDRQPSWAPSNFRTIAGPTCRGSG